MQKIKTLQFIQKLDWPLCIAFGFLFLLFLQTFFHNTIYYGQTVLNVALMGFLLWVWILYKNKQVAPPLLLYSGLSFLVFSWLSFFFSQTRTLGLNEVLLETGLILILFGFPAFFKEAKSKKDVFLALLLLIGLTQALWAFFQYLTRNEPRVAGFFFNPQILADYYPNAFALSSLLFLGLAFGFLYKKEPLWQILGAFSASALMTALFLSWSRGGILGLVGLLFLGIMVIAFRYKGFKPWLKFFGVTLMAGILAIALHFARLNLDLPTNHLVSKAQFAGTEAQTSVGERKDFMIGALKLSGERPFLGYGPNSFTSVYPQIQTIWLANAPHAHNWLIKIAMERGWPATLCFLSFWLMLLGFYLKKWRSHSDFSNWVFIAVLAGLGHNLIDFNFNFSSTILLLGLLGSVLLAELQTGSLGQKTRMTFWVANFLILILLILSGSVLYQNRYAQYAKYLFSKGYDVLNISPFFAGSDDLIAAQWNVQQQEFDLAEENFKKHLSLNALDANAWNQLGELYLSRHQYILAEHAFERALYLDGKNNWKYYLNSFKASIFQKNRDVLSTKAQVYLQELKAYLPLVKQNVHYTAQKENSQWALQVASSIQPYLTDALKLRAKEIQVQIEQARKEYTK